jgi:hypothetical protein
MSTRVTYGEVNHRRAAEDVYFHDLDLKMELDGPHHRVSTA